MTETIETSPFMAFARAQTAFEAVHRDKTVTVRTKAGGTYSFSYAPLEAIHRAVLPALNKEGLSLSEQIVYRDGKDYVRVCLNHSGGEFLHNEVPILVQEQGPQAFGSALTYARRYGITLLLGVCADDDDDGNAAEGNTATVTVTKNGNGAQETKQEAPRKQVKDYSERLVHAFEVGIDQAVLDIHSELQKNEELYRAVWGTLPSTMRRQIKEMIDRAKAAA